MCIMCICFIAGTLYAQPNQTSDLNKSTISTETEKISQEEIEKRISQTEKNETLPESVKTRIIDIYNQVLNQLRSSQESTNLAESYEKNFQDAPAMLQAIRDELANPTPVGTPPAFQEVSLAEAEQRLTSLEEELASAQKRVTILEAETKHRTDRRLSVPNEIADAREQLRDLATTTQPSQLPEEAPEVQKAKQILQVAKKMALEAKIKALENEIRSYDARGDLILARKDKAIKQVVNLESSVKELRELVNEKRRLEAEQAAQKAREAKQATAASYPPIKEMLERNSQLAEERTGQNGLVAKLERISREYQGASEKLSKTQEDFEDIHERIQAAGLTTSNGLFLLKKQNDLADINDLEKRIADRQDKIASVQLRLIELEEERSELADIDNRVRSVMNAIKEDFTEEKRTELKDTVKAQLILQRNYLESLKNDYDSYFMKLVDLDSIEQLLISETRELNDYIHEHILWIQNTSIFTHKEILRCWDALRWLFNWDAWNQWFQMIWQNMLNLVLHICFSLLLISLNYYVLAGARDKLTSIGGKVSHAGYDRFYYTLEALVLTFVLANLWPMTCWLASWNLGLFPSAPEQIRAASEGLRWVALIFLTMELLRYLFMSKGIVDIHFRWIKKDFSSFRKNLILFEIILLPLIFFIFTMEAQTSDYNRDALGRLAYICCMIAIGLLMRRILWLFEDLLIRAVGIRSLTWTERLRHLGYFIGVIVPIGLAILAGAGYYYSAKRIAWLMLVTLWSALGVFIVYSLLIRWFALYHRKMQVAQSLSVLAQHKEKASEETEETPVKTDIDKKKPSLDSSEKSSATVPVLDLDAVNEQVLSIIRLFTTLVLIGLLLFIWKDVFPAVNILDNVVLYYHNMNVEETVTASDGTTAIETVQKRIPITLRNLLFMILLLVMTVYLSRNLPQILDSTVLHWMQIDHGGRYAITASLGYGIIVFGILIALGTLGIGWGDVQWLVAAVSVGLGFGLQEIFSNFVSGIIIFMERPIRVGDTVTIGSVSGTVTQIRIRATTITDWDRKELIVPNREFVTGQLVNWTLTDPILRVEIQVGIAYGSDTSLAKAELLRVAKESSNVLKEPEPRAFFLGFGDNSLNFSLRVYVQSIEYLLLVKDEMHFAIDNAFRAHNIEISFPQRDLHFRTADSAIPIKLVGKENRLEIEEGTDEKG